MNLRRNAVSAIAVTTVVVGAISAAIIFPPPITSPIVDESTLKSTVEPLEQQTPQQQPTTEKPFVPVLIKVAISPEARVKATATAGQRNLQQSEWSAFTIVIDNAAHSPDETVAAILKLWHLRS